MLLQTTFPDTTVDTGGLFAFLGAYFFVLLVVWVIAIIGMWKTFTKAGKPGWAAIIPIYNVIVWCEIVGRPGWWVLLFFIPFVNIIIAIILAVELSKSFGHDVGFALGLIFLSFIFWPILGFGKSTYVGAAHQAMPPPGAPPAAPPTAPA